jgi:flagellar hook protein FlgE
MLSSLFSGISGLITEGHAMSVIGNNVANVNTVGFKGSRATFSDMLYQSIFGTAGTSQVGRGVALTSVDTMFEQGSFESTNEPTDLAIGGRGFFIVRSPESQANSYTRAGQFRFDKEGYMVNPTGMVLQGRPIDRVTNTPFSVATDILISQAPSEPKATGFIGMAVNLQSDAPWKGTVGSVTGTSGLSEVAQSENQYPRPGTYTATVDSLAAAQIGHTGSSPTSFGTEFVGAVIVNDYEIEMPMNNAPASAASLASYLNSMLTLASAGYASQVWVSWGVVGSDQYLSLSASATADGVDITFDDSAIAAGSTGWTLDDKTSTDLYGSTMRLNSVTTGPDGAEYQRTYAGRVSSQANVLRNWAGAGLDLTFTDPDNFIIPEGVSTFDVAGFESDQISATVNPAATSNYASSVTVYDTLGQPHVVSVYFRKAWEETANSIQTNVWEWYAHLNGTDSIDGQNTVAQWGYLRFNNAGGLMSGGDAHTISFDFSLGAQPNQEIDLVLGPQSGGGATTQYPLASTTNFQTQDGYAPGVLANVTVSTEGIISGHYSNGQILALYQITLAYFNNPWGLSRDGGNLFSESFESGVPYTNSPGQGSLGRINPNSLEQSNVDLATEFVKMIMTQRGYQANSRVITTTDEMLSELMNIKR